MTSIPDINSSLLALLFRQIRDAMWVRMAEELASAGHPLGFSQYIALRKLAVSGPCGATELAHAAELNPGAMTRLIDKLIKLDLIERLPDPDDRRAQKICLTAHGQRIWRDIDPCGARVRERTLAGISMTEREQLVHLLERIRHNLVADPA